MPDETRMQAGDLSTRGRDVRRPASLISAPNAEASATLRAKHQEQGDLLRHPKENDFGLRTRADKLPANRR
ncbi:hypothetical protein GCM10010994_56390 [Chelatococcus reniformis]|uniref:Uncharacterized protein n=1 Tax=Chelatococcus reniformis TaxID=1494448 RepID=A0A916XP60_9HYPH|nr:hypothetical protein GCM10010994_56390 [Chelatococcus reniformis]